LSIFIKTVHSDNQFTSTVWLSLFLGWGNVERKSGNISERRTRPIGTHQRPFERYHPLPPTASSSPKTGGSQSQPQTAIANISDTDCKFGRYIHRVHPNKSPLKIWEKRELGRIQGVGTAQIF